MEPDPTADPYDRLPLEGENAARIGSAFISLVEPDRGYERAYTRWYEDDHFYSGAMSFPWWFAGRRWIATRELRALRGPADAAGAPALTPLDAGWSLATYWITAGRLRDQAVWLEATIRRLRAEGRMFDQRTHVMTGFFELLAAWRAPGHEPRAVHALDHPYGGVVLELLDAPAAERREDLLAWLGERHVPERLGAGDASQCLCFAPLPWPGAGATSWFSYAGPEPQRLLLLWFLLHDPRSAWDQTFAAHATQTHASGHGRLAFTGGFVPTLPGSERYLDELR